MLTLALAAAAGCSLLVDGEQLPLRCSQEGAVGEPACDPGAVCRSGRCVAVTAGQGGVVGIAGRTPDEPGDGAGAGGHADAGQGGA